MFKNMFIVYFLRLLLTIISFDNASAEWRGPNNKHSFPQNFPAGWENDGRKLFITQCSRSDWSFSIHASIDENGNTSWKPGMPTLSKGQWHIGKAGTHLKYGATYSYGGKEKDCKKHVVFAPSNPKLYKWVKAYNGNVPQNAVRGFNDNERHFICRMEWANGVHPGKLIPSSKACYIGYGGYERASRGYEVLVRK